VKLPRTYPKIKKPLFYIQKPEVFEYKKVKFPSALPLRRFVEKLAGKKSRNWIVF
jgi:hypothetical protein